MFAETVAILVIARLTGHGIRAVVTEIAGEEAGRIAGRIVSVGAVVLLGAPHHPGANPPDIDTFA